MSVDFVGTMHAPVPLDALVATTRETLVRLLGLRAVPVIDVIADRRFDQGIPVDAGRRLGDQELGAVLVGERVPGPPVEDPSERDFDFCVAGSRDMVRLMMFDPHEHLGHEAPYEKREPVEAVFSPTRTCVGVVTAAALALAVGSLGDGEFIDAEVSLLQAPEPDPARMIELTRLPDRGDDFAARCERFMRQFARLNGWPRDVRLPPVPEAAG
ncbi:hypothetical protein ACSCB1_02930 [Streptomyces europaeiscabiei]|uniref:Uncharacterized protein n=1 Tax=Streptomyces europaeiscabiei TaxID=146819 RepID=A0ABU4NTS6_9ACTN|nr:hypothetical protein [Streptomyces europaeiscabiei]MDX3558182.1 hypothetical protein [Streptomyces europaeiscabiei]MDX3706011.1 hypothetical protein [Streptomyces europaeiscabiei]MDX3710239.1 hypothetical protein [Streptomyces europaeiscabiei]MDX3874210.1 hypothetical protein [Streptomyces europaeiscabiei]